VLSFCALLPVEGGSASSRLQHASAERRLLTARIGAADAQWRHWLQVMHRRAAPAARLSGLTLPALERAAAWRRRRALTLARVARHPPHLTAWLCIESHETGAPYPGWRTNSGNGYYGGLQFDRSFQQTYGARLYRAKGTAEHWTPLEQIWTAEYALTRGRGFAPWPLSARACGLL
jgi:transglycosylase-like protein